MPKLTKRFVDALKPVKRDTLYRDTDLKGFGLRVKPSGARTWLVQYRNRAGRTRKLALGKVGDALWHRVGREPSGNPFNSIVQLEHENGIPRNPFINAGAIVVSDVLLAGHQPREAIGEILRFIQFLADDETIIIDREVAASERATGYRNFALESPIGDQQTPRL